MANTKEEHLAKAQENIKFRASLDLAQEGAIGWSITMLFYSALHYIEAYFISRRGFGCKNHFSRATEIRRDPIISSIYDSYAQLETLSREARYDVSTFNAGDMRLAENCFEIIKKAIEAII